MADLSVNLAGIKSPNPFWIASGPPSNTAHQAHRAFEAGWGGVVWKTIGDPIVNVSSRYSSINAGAARMIGFNNIELISDRSPETNFREIAEVKKRWPDRAVIASLMVDTRERWHEFVKRSADSGADGIELNFGCPHGMCERGMGSAVGQQPAVTEKIVSWAMEAATIPVIVKLTPNITDVTHAARAAKAAGANAISLINTINSITQVNLDNLIPEPYVGGLSSHGGYCGPAVKPIALNMVQSCAADPEVQLPISGIGGIANWRDAAEFIALGSTSVQVCTAVMHYGFRIVADMIEGLDDYLASKGFTSIPRSRNGNRSISTTSASRESITTSALAAIFATSRARTARTSALIWWTQMATDSVRGACRANQFPRFAKTIASVAIFARWSVRWIIASPWYRWKPASPK
jgi:dihydropyrimidine dehydrogenase (NAD+) subunit PreA